MADVMSTGNGPFGIRFWGARGSIPVSGAEYRVYGGDTSCFEVTVGSRSFIIDAGSGLRRLGQAIMQAGTSEATLLLTHLHLDHIIGLSAFKPLFSRQGRVAIHAPAPGGANLPAVLARLFAEPFFPIAFERLPCRLDCSSFVPGATLSLGETAVRTIALRHGGGASGYRFDHAGHALVILTDHEHDGAEPEQGLVAFCRGADLVVYDGMWDETLDFEAHRGWGHSSWQAGLRLIAAAGAGRLACTHHAPNHDDTELSEREARLKAIQPASFFIRQDESVILLPR
ncbi:MBL fold metallo-hydrolase [Bosea sp. PAMC 26642]|uniref:MBL fold metallo-hydrolase n=1 Tax=Bosea sp. (strain PAMC 26642) TaxID=1792307 RepID=UPI00076FE161|nr:MBL fold metallo-hydrolase [Bosea sp. PAMC 26642]AMJ61734.1 hypothetical protein AXW83_16745 [Bosea sp. PAMC 26642]